MKSFILELNEFNEKLFLHASKKRNNLNKLVSTYEKFSFKIKDTYDSNYLEPWSQWVSIHCGKEPTEHKIMHLGDVSDLEYEFVWESYPNQFGAVWGCLNVRNPTSPNVNFLPDPWSSNTSASNTSYKNLLEFIRVGVNTKGDGFLLKAKNIIRLFYYFIKCIPIFKKHIDKDLLKVLCKKEYFLKLDSSMFYSIVEYISFKIFLDESKENKKNIIFLNLLAHCQHYYWNTDRHYKIDFCFDIIDLMVGLLYKKNKNPDVTVINGLSQMYSGDIEDWYSYFPISGWSHLINEVFDISCQEVNPCMSYDCIIQFNTQDEKENACKILEKIYCNNEPLFVVDTYDNNKLKIFVRLNYYSDIEAIVKTERKNYMFNDLFVALTKRTGKHIQRCDLYTNSKYNFDNLHFNYELYKFYARKLS